MYSLWLILSEGICLREEWKNEYNYRYNYGYCKLNEIQGLRFSFLFWNSV